MIILLFVAGLLVTGSANAVNQVVEKDTDALMQRTAKRPIPAGRNEYNGRMGICNYCGSCRGDHPCIFLTC